MPQYSISAPDGKTYTIEGPPGASQDEVIAQVLAQHPTAGTAPTPQAGFIPAVKAGFENLKGDAATLLGRAGIMGVPEAEAYREKTAQRAKAIHAPTQDNWLDSPLANLKDLAGGSLPYMVAPALAGAAATYLGAPAAVATGAGGLASVTQFLGSDLGRQVKEGTPLEQTNLAAAAAAAVPQAALDMLSMRMIPGIGRLFGSAGAKLTDEAASKIAQQGLKKVAADYAMSTGKTMGIEGLTEAGQQVLERLQAGLSITDKDAQKEYFDNFLGGAVLGGILAPGGRYVERAKAKARAEDADRKTKAAQQADAVAKEQQYRESPEYAQDLQKQYDALIAQREALKKQVQPIPKEATDEEKTFLRKANTDISAQLRTLSSQIAPIYAELRPLQAQMEQQRLTAMETEAGRTQPTAKDAIDNAAPTDEEILAQRAQPTPGPEMGVSVLPDYAALKAQRQALWVQQEDLRQAYEKATTHAEMAPIESRHAELKQQLDAVEQQLAAEPTTPAPAIDPALTKRVNAAQKALAKAQEEGDIEAGAKIRQRLADMQQETTRQANIPSLLGNNTNAQLAAIGQDNARMQQQDAVAPLLQRSNTNQDLLGARRDAEAEAATAKQAEYDRRMALAKPIQEVTGNGGEPMSTVVQEQRTLFPAQDLSATAQTGAGAVSAKSKAQLLADLQIARAAQNATAGGRSGRSEAVTNAIEALRDYQARADAEKEATREGSKTPGATQTASPAADIAANLAGTNMPENMATRQAAADARATAYGNMVGILDRFNRGRAAQTDLETAHTGVVDNLVAEIEAARGTPLADDARKTVVQQANSLLGDLRNRFGDTRNVIETGTKEEPEFLDPQYPGWAGGKFRDTGPWSEGPNVESRAPGKQTFSKPYAAAQSIQEGLDAIRNQAVSGKIGEATGVERTVTPRETTPEIVQDLLTKLYAKDPAKVGEDNRAIMDRVVDNLGAVQADLTRRQAVAEWANAVDQGREASSAPRVQAILDELEQGKRSETEQVAGETKTAVQQDMFPDTELQGKLFDSYAEFEQYLASDALRALRQDVGPVIDTIQRTQAQIVPLQKRAEELSQNLKNLTRLYEQQKAIAGEQVEKVTARYEQAKAKLQALMDTIDAQVKPLQDRLDFAQAWFSSESEKAAQVSKDIAANIAKYGRGAEIEAAAERASQAKQAVARAQRELDAIREANKARRLDAKWHGTEPANTMEAASRLESAFEAQNAAEENLRKIATSLPGEKALLNFLNKDLALQLQLRDHNKRLAKLQKAVDATRAAVETAKAEVLAQPEVKQALKSARRDVTMTRNKAEQVRETTSATSEKLRGEVSNAQRAQDAAHAQVDEEMRPILEQQRRRTEKPKFTEAPEADLERREAARIRARRQKRSGELGDLPGQRVSYARKRDALATLESMPERISAAEAKAEDETLPKTTRDKAARQARAMRQTVEDAHGVLSNDSGVAAETLQALNAKLERAIEKREAKRAAVMEDGISDTTKDSRKRELRALQREVRRLSNLAQGFAGRPDVTEILSGKERDAYKEDTAQYETLQDMARAAAEEPALQLPPRKKGPAVRKQTSEPGIMRTGDNSTVEQRRMSPRRPITSGGAVAPVTSKQAVRAAGKDVAVEQAMLEMDRLEGMQERLNAALVKAEEAGDAARVADLTEKSGRLDKAIEKAQAAVDKAVGNQRESAVMGRDDLDYPNKPAEDRISTPLSEETKSAVHDGRILDTMSELMDKGSTPYVRDMAAALRPFLLRTKLDVVPDLKLNGESVAGVYSPTENAVHMHPEGLTEEDVIHEVGHAATIRALTAPMTSLTPTQQKARRGIESMFEQIRNHDLFKHEHAAKNAIEFASEVISNAQLREKLDSVGKPQTLWKRFVSYIKDLLGFDRGPEPLDSAKATEYVKQLFQSSRKIDAQSVPSRARADYGNQAGSALADMSEKIVAVPKTFMEKVKANTGLAFEMQTVDMRAPLAKAGEQAGTKAWQQAIYNVRKADQLTPVVQAALSNGPLELYTDDKGFHGVRSSGGVNAKQIFEAVSELPGGNAKAKMAMATSYLIARRAADVGLNKLDPTGALGVTQKSLDAVMAQVNADPALKKTLETVHSLYKEYNTGMINFLAKTGALPKDKAAELLKDGGYVPYYRIDEGGMAQLVFSGETTIDIGDVRHQPYLNELKGSGAKILPLDESLPRNTMLITSKAMTNLAAKGVAYALQDSGAGTIKRGQGPAGVDIVHFNQEPDASTDRDDGKRWIRVSTEGTPFEGIPSDMLVKSLEGAHITLPAFLKLGGIAGDWLRAGVTRNPMYIARQLIRDPMAASFTAGLNYGPLKAVFKAGKEYVAQNRGDSETARKLIEKGLLQSNIFTGDPDDLSKMALQLASGKDQGTIDKLFKFMDKQAMMADATTRVMVYENAIKNGLSEVEAELMTMESMNFHKRGLSPTIQYANRLIPFFNAQIQGLNVLAKAARGNMPFSERQNIQRKFINNAVLLMGTGLAYAMMMDDDEYYKNAKPRDRYNNFFIHVPGVEEPIKVPIPYESGYFFSAALAAVDGMKDDVDSAQHWKAIKDTLLSSVPGYSSMGVPQIAKPLAEVWTNKNFFSGLPVESASVAHLSPEARYNANTTELAKQLGKVLPFLSPVQIEHLTRGYFGTLPLAAAAAANELFARDDAVARPERRINEIPVFGQAFQGKFGGADADAAYALANKAKEAKTTFDHYAKTGETNKAREYLESNKDQIRLAPLANQFTQRMAEYKKYEAAIRAQNTSADAKRKSLDKLDGMRQEYADKFMRAYQRISASAPS